MSKWIVYALGAFFVLGGLDYLFGSKLKLGGVFLETLKKTGLVMLGVLGIYSLAPAAAPYVKAAVTPLAQALGMEPAAFPAMFFAIDMGGYDLSTVVMRDAPLGLYFAVVVSSLAGAAVSYTIPVSVTMIKREHFGRVSLGILSGVACIPVGCLLGGLLAGLPVLPLLWSLVPLCVLAALLAFGLLKNPDLMAKVFTVFGSIMAGISLLGLLIQGVQLIFGIVVIPGMASLSDGMVIVARIVFIMCGGMTLLTLLKRLLKKPLAKAAQKLRVNENAVVGMLAAAVTVVIPFSDMDAIDERGQTLVCAYGAGGAFVIGGQLGLVGGLAPELILPFIVAKLVVGILGVILSAFLLRIKAKKPNTAIPAKA